MVTETGVQLLLRDESGGFLYSWPGGARHKGGASSVQALVWNVGTPRRDAATGQVEGRSAIRENLKQLKLQGGEYQCVAGGRTAS
jgi:hypothetical protein